MDKFAILKKDNIQLAKGKREVLRGLLEDKIDFIFLATDADENFKKEIHLKSQEKNVECVEHFSKFQLADYTKMEIPCAVIGVIK